MLDRHSLICYYKLPLDKIMSGFGRVGIKNDKNKKIILDFVLQM